MKNKVLLYFGCIERVGHFLWRRFEGSLKTYPYTSDIIGVNPRIFAGGGAWLDGPFTPAKGPGYQESIIPPLRIVSWVDTSVDHRDGSHSTFIGYGFDSAEEILDAAMTEFPEVMQRQPRPKPNQLS